MRKSILIFFVLLSLSAESISQKILLEDAVDDSIMVSDKGPNSKYFTHFYYALGNIIPNKSENIDLEALGSMYHEFGWRYKRKWNEVLSSGFAVSVSLRDYKLTQDSVKTFPSSYIYEKEKIRIDAANMEIYQRFNFDNRGDYMGIFLDIGIRGEWNYYSKHIIIANSPDTNLGKKQKIIYKSPGYLNPFNYSLVVRAGVNNVILWISYSLDHTIKLDRNNDDFAKLWIGLQLSLHR